MYPLVGDRSDIPDDSVPFSQFVDKESDRSSETFLPTPKLYVVEFEKLEVGAAKVCGPTASWWFFQSAILIEPKANVSAAIPV